MICREIPAPPCETGARTPEGPMRTCAVRCGFAGRACWLMTHRRRQSIIVAEALGNIAGEISKNYEEGLIGRFAWLAREISMRLRT